MCLSLSVFSVSVSLFGPVFYLLSLSVGLSIFNPLCICSVQQTESTCIYAGVNISTSRFSATHILDIKILPDCMSPGDPKRCDNKTEAL